MVSVRPLTKDKPGKVSMLKHIVFLAIKAGRPARRLYQRRAKIFSRAWFPGAYGK